MTPSPAGPDPSMTRCYSRSPAGSALQNSPKLTRSRATRSSRPQPSPNRSKRIPDQRKHPASHRCWGRGCCKIAAPKTTRLLPSGLSHLIKHLRSFYYAFVAYSSNSLPSKILQLGAFVVLQRAQCHRANEASQTPEAKWSGAVAKPL